jgi:hypothetical protein
MGETEESEATAQGDGEGPAAGADDREGTGQGIEAIGIHRGFLHCWVQG